MPRVADLGTPEERRAATEPARLASRFSFAQDRIKRIVDGWPPLTETQKAKLACILLTPAGGDDA
jgi:hypothetical protein